MAVRETSVFGVYSDRFSTENAIDALRAAGFRNTDISALFPDQIHTKNLGQRKQAKVPQVAAFAVTGAIASSLLSWLANSGAFPVLETFVSGGPVLTILAGLGAGGALGCLINALTGIKVQDFEDRYEGRVRRGDILISVRCDESHWTARAEEILQRTGADDVSSRSATTTGSLQPNRRINLPTGERALPPALRMVTNRGAQQ